MASMYHVCMSSLSCWCSLHVYPSLSVHPFLFPSLSYSSFPSPSSPPLPGAIQVLVLEHLNSFDHYVDDILAYKHIRSHLDGVALQNDVNIIVNWIESTRL